VYYNSRYFNISEYLNCNDRNPLSLLISTMQLAQKHIWLTKEMQFETVCTMINNIRIALTPLLIICFMCGLRIIEFPTNHSKPWFSFMYMLLLWSVYFLLFNYIMISYIIYDIMYSICFYLNFFIILVSIAFGIYHDKVTKSYNNTST